MKHWLPWPMGYLPNCISLDFRHFLAKIFKDLIEYISLGPFEVYICTIQSVSFSLQLRPFGFEILELDAVPPRLS